MKNLLLAKMQTVLETMAHSGRVSINELSEKLNIPLPTLSRLISDMCEMKLIEKINYYQVAPAAGMIRLGECARKHSILVQTVVPELKNYADKVQMNFILAAFDNNTMFNLYSSGNTDNSSALIWESGLAMVLMERAGLSDAGCIKLFRDSNPGYSDTDLVIFEREMDSVRQSRTFFRTNTMRRWGCSHSFVYRNQVCGFCIYGQAPENCSREKFVLNCDMLLSHITSALNEE